MKLPGINNQEEMRTSLNRLGALRSDQVGSKLADTPGMQAGGTKCIWNASWRHEVHLQYSVKC